MVRGALKRHKDCGHLARVGMSLPEKSQTYGPFKDFAPPPLSKLLGIELLEDRTCTHGMDQIATQKITLED